MNEATQHEAAAPSDTTFDFLGMKVHVSDLFPTDYLGILPNPPWDFRNAYQYGMIGDITDHSIEMVKYVPIDTVVSIHDLLEQEPVTDLHREVMRLDAERRIARFEREFLGTVISSNITSTAQPIDATAILADIERLIAEAEETKRKQDRALVETFLDAGFMVTVSEVAHKPMMILTEDFRDTFEEIMEERTAERVR